MGFILILIVFFYLCRKKRGKKTSTIDAAAVKHSEVEILSEKPIGELENGNGGCCGYGPKRKCEGRFGQWRG